MHRHRTGIENKNLTASSLNSINLQSDENEAHCKSAKDLTNVRLCPASVSNTVIQSRS